MTVRMGMTLGCHPAVKASWLDPIDVVRLE